MGKDKEGSCSILVNVISLDLDGSTEEKDCNFSQNYLCLADVRTRNLLEVNQALIATSSRL
jgi:hypothetical protein